MTAADQLAQDICPNCLSTNIEVQPDYISCKSCGLHGNPKEMRFCERVPVLVPVNGRADGKLYEHGGVVYRIVGYAPGCGRPLSGEWCDSCRKFIPRPYEKTARRAEKSGKDAAAGELEL